MMYESRSYTECFKATARAGCPIGLDIVSSTENLTTLKVANDYIRSTIPCTISDNSQLHLLGIVESTLKLQRTGLDHLDSISRIKRINTERFLVEVSGSIVDVLVEYCSKKRMWFYLARHKTNSTQDYRIRFEGI